MKVKELFERPINRSINGVIKAEQFDADSVWQELEEYVVTRELDIHLRKFFEAYLNAIDNSRDTDVASRVGVWVSGFFGSGKSHFIKILSYLLENRSVTRNGLSKNAIDFFQDKIQDPLLAADIKRAVGTDVDVILFNIDSKASNADGRDVILRVFLKVFNERLGYCGDHPHIAHMERYLAKTGKLEKFHAVLKDDHNIVWKDERDAYQFHADALANALSKVLGEDIKDADAWLSRFEQDFSLSVESFSKWVKEYLDTKGSGHRIIFLVDEIGQFIGQDTHLMLNLQTITENLGTTCNGRAWVVVTSQEDMDTVLGDLRAAKTNDFSKIQGRFRTRLSLSGANADEVIQKRLLAKVDGARAELEAVFAQKADILKNQLSFKNVGMTLKPYADKNDFVAVYPFVPYQFQLVQKVFESSRKYGATGLHLAKGERSMLDAFQTGALDVADEQIGVLVPLYRFYPAIESFLEGVVRRAIEGVKGNPSLESFDEKVLKTLFLIRYVDEISGNIDNLVTLFIDRIDADRLELRRQIEASLLRLEKETLVNRNGEEYFFLTNEERDISREIKDVDLGSGEETKLLGDLVFEEILGTLRKYRYPENNRDFGVSRLCDLHPYGSRSEGDLVISIVTPLADEYGDFNEARCITQSTMDDGQALVRLDDDKALARELRTYLQTDKYIKRKNDGTATPTTLKILRERQEENRERKERLKAIIERLMKEAKYYSAGQALPGTSGSVGAAVDDALKYLVKNTYPKLAYIKNPVSNPQAEIRAVLAAPVQDGLGLESGSIANADALKEVVNYVALMGAKSHRVVLFDLVEDRFGRRPYGWSEWETVLLVARLVMMGELSLVTDGDNTLMPEAIYSAIDGPNKWRRISVVKRQTVDRESLQKARAIAKDIFQSIAPDGEDALTAHIRAEFSKWQSDLASWKPLADTGNYPGSAPISDALGVIAKTLKIQDSYQFLSHLIEYKDDFLDLEESVVELRNFYESQRPTWEKLRAAKQTFDLNRYELLKDADAAAGLKKIDQVLTSESPYGLIKDADTLIGRVGAINSALVSKRREHVIEKIDEFIAKVKGELDQVGAAPELRNQCLHPIQSIKVRIEKEQSIAHIFQMQTAARDAADEAFGAIELAARKPAPVPAGGDGNASGSQGGDLETAVKNPATKKRRIIEPSDLAGAAYLETKEDIEGFLAKLRKELEDAIANNERVEIR
ncbi:BREX system P-loop protein BrxC [Brucella tritici]|uniref:BREX system P-loop protein BrxC n=1 Tax=Brucella tritici TaxID=94626 RepID=UPI00124E70B6|nr:BREX system P-loop protein BrxC [Brucella tritici]KAB2678311.1 BREX system P-loop protein BrxC [Brucella tritici]